MKALKINTACQEALSAITPQSDSRFGVGVLIGQLENQNYLVVDVIPLNLPQPANETIKFDEFLAQANEQEEPVPLKLLNLISNVKMMLVGGIHIVGLVVHTNFADFENNSHGFKNLVDSMKEVMPGKTDVNVIVQNKSKKKDEYLIYDFNQRKFSAIDYQFISFKDRVFKLSTNVEVELIVPCGKEQNRTLKVFDISEKLRQPVRRWTTDLSHGIVKVGGAFFDKSETLENIKAKLKQKDDLFECEVFSSLPVQKVFAGVDEEKADTTISFKGTFTAFAYVLTKKTALKDAYQVLITDLLQGVQNKLNLFVSMNEDILQSALDQNKIFFLPSRTYFEFAEKSSNLFTYCDYLLSGENLKDCEDRLKEWFSLTPKFSDTIEYKNSESFQSSYLKYQEKKKAPQQKEGVSQRKAEKKEPENRGGEEQKSVQQGDSLKDNNIVKYGALIGVVIIFILIRFLVF